MTKQNYKMLITYAYYDYSYKITCVIWPMCIEEFYISLIQIETTAMNLVDFKTTAHYMYTLFYEMLFCKISHMN